MKIIVLCMFILILLIGIFITISKFDKSSRPLTTKADMFYEIRNKSIIFILVFIWIFSVITGLCGIWKHVTAPLLISVSALLTTYCIISIFKKYHCNVCLGICSIYFGYLCLIATFKIGYWQFAISYWWVILALISNTLISLLILRNFLKTGKQIPKSMGRKLSFSAIEFAPMGYLIARALINPLKANNTGNDIFVCIIMTFLSLFALVASSGVRYLVLDDRVAGYGFQKLNPR